MTRLITNNPEVLEKYKNRFDTVFVEGGYKDVLLAVRDLIHEGSSLLTHPLMGSLKPNETVYRSVAVDVKTGPLDMQSLNLIEEAIVTYDKFALVVRPDRGMNATERMKADFRAIDLSLISSALDK